jgi:hypothetical protein
LVQGGSAARVCPDRRGPAAALAPLAQSAERFHGKEKVVSSILTGGSLSKRTELGGPGGVAQSVRALGS